MGPVETVGLVARLGALVGLLTCGTSALVFILTRGKGGYLGDSDQPRWPWLAVAVVAYAAAAWLAQRLRPPST